MSKHTPGAWRVLPGSNQIVRIFTASNGVVIEQAVAVSSKSTYIKGKYVKNSSSQISANAQLIAAAPELLDACKMALEQLPGDPQDEDDQGAAIRACIKAIAKAEGR